LNAQGSAFFQAKNTFEKNIRWEVHGGRYTVQFNPDKAISDWVNTYQSLARARNFIRLYEKDFFRVQYQQKKAQDWTLRASFEWATRNRLENLTTQTFFPPDSFTTYGTNQPDAKEWNDTMPISQKASVLSLAFEFRPWQRYEIRNGRKRAIPNSSPNFILTYRKGIPEFLGGEVAYDFLGLQLQHTLNIRSAGVLDLRLETGWFPNNTRTGFADFKHFPGNQIHVIGADPIASYRMLPYYQYSTQEAYVSGFAHYQFRKLLLTQFPTIWMLGLKENIFLNYLSTQKTGYVEFGYGLDNIMRFFRVEAAAAFDNGKYQGVRLFLGVSSSLDAIGQIFR
jgi:hypothetical protein